MVEYVENIYISRIELSVNLLVTWPFLGQNTDMQQSNSISLQSKQLSPMIGCNQHAMGFEAAATWECP